VKDFSIKCTTTLVRGKALTRKLAQHCHVQGKQSAITTSTNIRDDKVATVMESQAINFIKKTEQHFSNAIKKALQSSCGF
jgi:predicted HAD superfamily phosphohydrolase YqeG